jgi:hypothetical protein
LKLDEAHETRNDKSSRNELKSYEMGSNHEMRLKLKK